MAKPLVTVENLSVSFDTARGQITALRGVSFSVESGEILGIVGESGSGKSVACHSILKLLPGTARLTSGRICVDGQDVAALPERDLVALRGRRVAMIFQNPSTHLDPLMTVGQQIGEAIRIHFKKRPDDVRLEVTELLRSVRIADPERRIDAYPHELSGGMKQRVMIAAALACEPAALIADEPTTALDVTVQASILALLKDLRAERGLSIILVSHDLGVIAQMCDRIVVMKEGRVVEVGSREEVLFRPQADYTRKLIAAHPEIGRREIGKRAVRVAAPSVSAAEKRSLLSATDLEVYFGADSPFTLSSRLVKAVDGVSLSLKRGETLGLVGESGSGKSTVARVLAGLQRPTAGKACYQGWAIESLRGRDRLAYRRAVQMVFQDPFTSLNPRFTAAQTLAEPLLRHRMCSRKEVSNRVRELMAAVELPPSLRDRRPHQLSGGQRQRVGIARALALEPEVLIADEVTSALDVTIQAQILELLARLREEMNLTILFISHDLGVVQRLCQNVAVMRGGRVVEYGPSERILENPRESYTRELLAAVPRLYPVTHEEVVP